VLRIKTVLPLSKPTTVFLVLSFITLSDNFAYPMNCLFNDNAKYPAISDIAEVQAQHTRITGTITDAVTV